jgi:hypothetical protein
MACAGLVVVGACGYYFLAPAGAPLRRASAGAPSRPAPVPLGRRSPQGEGGAVDPITAKKLEIFELASKRPADPDLVALYGEVNQRHFAGTLPAIPVMWDDALAEVDALVGGDYHLQGMTDGSLMLVSPALREDEAELQRTVCHEAVHVRLHRASGANANHGQAFQGELRRIFEEGCFTAILATEAEQQALKQWIDDETARLHQGKAQIDADRARVDAERADVERAISDLNARIVTANAQRSGWPGEEEQQALSARRIRALQASSDYNVALSRLNSDAGHLNREIERYRLMVAYPRGVDEETVVRRE